MREGRASSSAVRPSVRRPAVTRPRGHMSALQPHSQPRHAEAGAVWAAPLSSRSCTRNDWEEGAGGGRMRRSSVRVPPCRPSRAPATERQPCGQRVRGIPLSSSVRSRVGGAAEQPRLHDDRHEGAGVEIALKRQRERGRGWRVRGWLCKKLSAVRILVSVGLGDAEPAEHRFGCEHSTTGAQRSVRHKTDQHERRGRAAHMYGACVRPQARAGRVDQPQHPQ